MASIEDIPARRTSADVVYENLYEQIITLGLMPGEKISEADIADQFGISRQPVRDAFNRLGNLGLLTIKPQRATQVQKFSMEAIASARFVRTALELEITRTAAKNWSEDFREQFADNLKRQDNAEKEGDAAAFHMLDEEFHELIANVAQKPHAFEIAKQNKAQVDRLCWLSLKDTHEIGVLVSDHRKILESIKNGALEALESTVRLHLSRIDKTIHAIHESHSEYFTR